MPAALAIVAHVGLPRGLQQGHPEPATDLAAQGGHDAQRRLVGGQQGIHQGDGLGGAARQQRISHRQALVAWLWIRAPTAAAVITSSPLP
jgi:hypothetical protein